MHLERADGGRQDLAYDAAVALYIDRLYMVKYLHSRVFQDGHSNLLEDFIYVTHRAVEYIAMMRANALIDIRVARPMRWLAGKSAELAAGWSPVTLGLVFEKLEKTFELAAEVSHSQPHTSLAPSVCCSSSHPSPTLTLAGWVSAARPQLGHVCRGCRHTASLR